MEQQQSISTTKIALKYGIYIGLGSALLVLVLWALKLEEVAGLQLLDNVIWIAGLVIAMQEFRKLNGGYMKFGQGFNIGLMGGTIAGLIDGFYASIHYRFLNPNLLVKIKDEIISGWEKANMNEEQMEMLKPYAEFIASPNFMFFGGVIGGLLAGLIFGLIISAILQKENTTNPFGNN